MSHEGIRPEAVITHTVGILAPDRREPRIEALGSLRDRGNTNVIRQSPIDALGIYVARPVRHVNVCHLTVRMHPRISATGTYDLNRLLEQVTQNAFHFALHGAQPQGLRLSSPPVEVTPVVRDLQT